MIQPGTTITIDLGDAAGERQLAFADVQRIIGGHLNTANYGMAASVSMQLANQLPQDIWPQYIAAESLYQHQQIEPALRYIDRALELDPANIASLVVKSRLCVQAGDQTQAVQLIDSAIHLAPLDSHLHSIKAELLVNAGAIEDARDSFVESIDLDPRNADALLGLSRLPGDNFSDELLKKVEFIAQSRQLSAADQVKVHFSLATIYDKKTDHTRHFLHLNAGNDLKNRSLKHNPTASMQEAKGTIDYFSADFFAQRSIVKGNSENIIFIVGFPRCGSTLVEQILSSHPDVSAGGEIYALKHAIRDFQHSRGLSPGYPYWVGEQPAAVLAEIAAEYLHKVEPLNQSTFLTDKMLDNYKFIGVIQLIFPNAIIINVQRNPVDVCYSCYKHLFSLNSLPFTYHLENLAHQYNAYRRVIRHWDRVLPGKIHTVEYEQLVRNQEEFTRDLLTRCKLPWHDACLNFHQNMRTVQTSSSIQVRQKLYTHSINRWKLYEQYLGPLLELTNE